MKCDIIVQLDDEGKYMGYDLRPRNKKINTFSMGAFSYAWMMENGVGLVVGYGKGIVPGSYLAFVRPDNKDLMLNDGGWVSAKEAKEMAKVAKRLAEYQELLSNQFNKLDEKTKKRYLDDLSGVYNVPIRLDFIEKIKKFAEFAEKSGGFKVY